MSPSESSIEKKVCTYAVNAGFLAYKFSSPAHRGVPDRIFLGHGRCFFIEFKMKGKVATKRQLYEHKKIMKSGFDVYVIDSVELGINLISKLVKT